MQQHACCPANFTNAGHEPEPDDGTLGTWECGGKPWRTEDFADFLTRGARSGTYNEIIVDSKAWRADGPLVVEAIFGNKEIHRGFIDKFPHLAASHPFMVFDPLNWHSPLSLAH